MYSKARTAVEAGEDTQIGEVYVCSVCGWTGEGHAPDNCPLCNAKKELIVEFE